ncbi:MAG: DNA polymerase I [Pirellulaceae bacterium]|nr:DNA polymerase I [Pirellulaceae bacterium]
MARTSRQKTFFDIESSEQPSQKPPAVPPSPVPEQPLDESTVYVIDAHSLIYQVFFAMGEMTSPAGQPVNAVYGFVRDMLDIIEKKKPGHLICTFDQGSVTFRNEMYAEYKAHRDPMPDDLRSQIPLIQKMLHALGIPVLGVDNFEADDLMATLARKIEERGGRCYLVTNDKDCRQLITGRVKLFNIRKNRVYDETSLMNDWGIRPNQVVDFQAMVGDSADNVPGLPSVGPKTAQKYLDQFGSLDGLLSGVEQLKSKKQQEKIRANVELARLSRDLVRLDNQVPMEIDWESARIGNIDVQAAVDLCDQFGFRSLAKRIGEMPIAQAPDIWETDYRLVADLEELAELVRQLEQTSRFAIDTETTSTKPREAELVGFSVAWGVGQAAYVPVMAPEGQVCLNRGEALRLMRPLLENSSIEKIGQNLKYDMIVLRQLDIDLQGPIFDTMVADYLLDAGQRNHGIDDLARRYLNHRTIKIKELIGTGKNQRKMNDVDVELVARYAAEDADIPFRLYEILRDRLEKAKLLDLFHDVEMPLVRVLAEMEFNGIRLDVAVLKKLSGQFSEAITQLRAEIYQIAGEEFNIDSPQQLAGVLFDKLELPVVKKTATGRSTAVDVLETLAEQHELPQKIIGYRQFAKLRSTYTDALLSLINPKTERVHTSFMQDVAATGRLSSQDPNLQNIPIRTDAGRQIREAFVADPKSWTLLSADYSQIELRMLAHFTQDQNLLSSFTSGHDIHAAVAAEIHDVDLSAVTKEMRRAAKAVNFGIIYGQTPFGLGKAIGVSKEEASEFIDNYFARYPSVREFTDGILATAHRDGHVTTILGRRRRIEGVRNPENIKNHRFLTFPERTAINTVIQGSAADLIKLAMLKVHREIETSQLPMRLLLQIHDELVFEFDPQQQDSVLPLVSNCMTSAVALQVPIQVDMEMGDCWGGTQPIDFVANPDKKLDNSTQA